MMVRKRTWLLLLLALGAAAILAAFVGSGVSDAQIVDRLGVAAKNPAPAPVIVFEDDFFVDVDGSLTAVNP